MNVASSQCPTQYSGSPYEPRVSYVSRTRATVLGDCVLNMFRVPRHPWSESSEANMRRWGRYRGSAWLIALAVVGGNPIRAQTPSADTNFVRTNAMVQMRDGVKLNTDVYTPKRSAGSLP